VSSWTSIPTAVTPVTDADYEPSVGAALDWFANLVGNQPNDPSRAAGAILQVVESDDPPLRLLLGTETVAAIREKLLTHKAELDAWERLSVSTS
jgi:hypothetical protein